jgi:NitT/TauT family transport system permease protein
VAEELAQGGVPEQPGLRNRATTWLGASLQSLASVLAVLGLWELLARALEVPRFILPLPSEIFSRTIEVLPVLWDHALVTLWEIGVGFTAAVIGGILLGILVGSSPIAERALNPIILFFQVVPKSALAPLLIIWMGTGIGSKVALVFLIAFFPILVQMLAGMRSVDERVVFLARSSRANRRDQFFKITLPHSLPYLFAGMRVAITLSVVGAIVAEFVASREGLGYFMLIAFGRLDTTLVMAALLVLSAMAMVLYAFVGFAEGLVIPWHVSRRRRTE